MENIKAMPRNKKAIHDSRKLRREGKVPGVLYGRNMSNILFEIGEMELSKGIHKNGEHGLMNIEIDGKNYSGLLKEVQRDPVNHKIMHIDMEDTSEAKIISTEVPIFFMGEESITKKGIILQKEKNSIKLQCKPESLPRHIDINVAQLELGSVIKLRDIEFSREISVIDDLSTVIASVSLGNTREIEPVESSPMIVEINTASKTENV